MKVKAVREQFICVEIIGRRLVEACTSAVDAELPPSIARQLAALRESEQRRAGRDEQESESASGSLSNGSDEEGSHAR